MVDKVGTRISITIFQLCVLIGQVVFAIGVHLNLYWLLLLGRFIFGLGAETQSMTAFVITTEWFGVKELAFAMAI